jgi:sorbitol-specific phosphotransferase system component IIA
MAKHNVYFNLPDLELGKVDVIFDVYTNNRKTGTITISKGSIEWYPKKAKHPYRLTWKQFDTVMKK